MIILQNDSFFYFIDSNSSDIQQSQIQLLSQLLHSKLSTQITIPNNQFIILPRVNTISPWSSKAIDILHSCGFSFISHITPAYLTPSSTAHDPMTQSMYPSIPPLNCIFPSTHSPKPLFSLPDHSIESIQQFNHSHSLALSPPEISYLSSFYSSISRSPTDAELFMFAQVNSEHCRHKIFSASWIIDNIPQKYSLFQMIKNTYSLHPQFILSAYSDNAAVLHGFPGSLFSCDPTSLSYSTSQELIHTLIKVETHNHPTAVSPFPGAATGSGGEIRDEGAVGQGSKAKAGLSGFTVSDLLIPQFIQPWESNIGKPNHLSSSFDIMIKGPLGAAAFNNEFGRPSILGYFRTFLQNVVSFENTLEWRGFHKPIMIAGGMGSVRPMHILKKKIIPGSLLIVLGGPCMLIGLGGGAASSMTQGANSEALDFASVQRENPEMQRRAQMVIDFCTALGNQNPIISIHDVGAGGLSNALPELVHDSDLGADLQLRNIIIDDSSMSPMEIWCNESQERYVLAIAPESLDLFKSIAERERALYAVVGVATAEKRLILRDSLLNCTPIDLPMDVLFGNAPKLHRNATTLNRPTKTLEFPPNETIANMIDRLLALPTIASKSFLVTIGDRSVTGLVGRDQMVGQWQVPVADVSVILSDYENYTGQAMSMGERPPIALLNPAASARMAVGEALTNLVAANVTGLECVRLSANWMSAADHPGEGYAIYEAVKAIGLDMCPQLGITIPVGKDSMSMKTKWDVDGSSRNVTSPLSVVITAYGPVPDARMTLTPQLQVSDDETRLIFIDLSAGKQRLGGSCLAQVYSQLGEIAPDVENYSIIKSFYKAMAELRNPTSTNEFGHILAYHDRSDGGLFTTILEMCFAGHVGCNVDISSITIDNDIISSLFNEELGAIIQIKMRNLSHVNSVFKDCGYPLEHIHDIGKVVKGPITFTLNNEVVYTNTREILHRKWAETSYKMQSLRDNPECAKLEYDNLLDECDPGLSVSLSFEFSSIPNQMQTYSSKPKVAILREQGVNSFAEMAWAFYYSGFEVIDVHMTDIINGKQSLSGFNGLACPGGFSYGDVLGAGVGWATSILYNENANREFAQFFKRDDTFTLGICNGCQMLANLKDMIPGAENWPKFMKNTSRQFEARVSMVEICDSPSIFLKGMQGSKIPIAVAHGEGRAEFKNESDLNRMVSNEEGISTIAVRYVDNYGEIAGPEKYPFNPNGSVLGISAVTSTDGRVLAMMPHPERVIRGVSNTWNTNNEIINWKVDGPWIEMFRNARKWIEHIQG